MNIVHFKEHKVVEKEESSSYLSRFWCLDNVAHHKFPEASLFTTLKKQYTQKL